MARNKISEFDRQLRHQIAENIKNLSRKKGLSQLRLHEITGIPQSTLSGYFSERSTINAGNAQKIADALGVDKSDIDPRFSTTLDVPKISEPAAPYYTLNEKEKKDIAVLADNLLEGIESGENLNFYGEPATDEQMERLRVAIRTAMEMNKEEAKKKFTRKDYRK